MRYEKADELLSVNHSAFHNKGNFLNHADVLQRIFRNGDDIGEKASLQFTNLSLPSKQFCAIELQDRQGCHAVL